MSRGAAKRWRLTGARGAARTALLRVRGAGSAGRCSAPPARAVRPRAPQPPGSVPRFPRAQADTRWLRSRLCSLRLPVGSCFRLGLPAKRGDAFGPCGGFSRRAARPAAPLCPPRVHLRHVQRSPPAACSARGSWPALSVIFLTRLRVPRSGWEGAVISWHEGEAECNEWKPC